MRRLARSTASQGQTLRRRWPTKVHISSSSSASHSFSCSFLGRKRGSGGEAAGAFFIRLAIVSRETPVTRAIRALRIALTQQVVNLRVLYRFGHGGGGKTGLVPAAFALVFGMTPSAAIVANMLTAASGAEMLRKNHPQN